MKRLAIACAMCSVSLVLAAPPAYGQEAPTQPNAIARLIRQEDARWNDPRLGLPEKPAPQPSAIERLVLQEDARARDPRLGVENAVQTSEPPAIQVVRAGGFDWLAAAIGAVSGLAVALIGLGLVVAARAYTHGQRRVTPALPGLTTLAQANGSSRRQRHSSIEFEEESNERKGAEETMTKIKTLFGLLVAVVAAVVGVVAFGAAQASASSAPIVIPYAKTCDETVGHCESNPGSAVTLEMQVTTFRATGNAARFTLTEWITVGDISFTAEMNGHRSPAGFIVLNGTVTEGSFAGARVHQRSNLVSGAGDHDVVDRRAPAHAGECVSRITEPGGAGLDPGPSPVLLR